VTGFILATAAPSQPPHDHHCRTITAAAGSPATAPSPDAADHLSEEVSVHDRALPADGGRVHPHHPVQTHLGLKYVDLGWSESKVAVEFDGRVKYEGGDGGAAFYQEKRRQDALEERGWLVVRVMWEDLQQPDAVVARLWEALRSQQRRRTSR